MSQSKYEEYLERKLQRVPPTGLVSIPELPDSLFNFQKDITRWALKRGRCAIFAATGLGKTRMQLAWAKTVNEEVTDRVLIVSPLAVANQTKKEGENIGIKVNLCRENEDVDDGINIINYDRLHKIDTDKFGAVVLDESSIIKNFTSKTLGTMLEIFRDTPFKLCATATPSPNDYTELGTHAEFLGICTRAEMLAEFFVHDGAETQIWRLKKHGKNDFWRWVSSWGALVSMPSDLGYSNEGYQLKPLNIVQHMIPADRESVKQAGLLFATEANTLSERRNARKASTDARVKACADLVNSDKQPWVVWCELNKESELLKDSIEGAVEIKGSDDPDVKERRLIDFADGKIRVLVTKPSIAGFGLNWQHCCRMAFVGVTDSWEAYFQAVRRCWRFGQKKDVRAHVFASELEGAVVRNLQRKEADARTMQINLSFETRMALQQEIKGQTRSTNHYNKQPIDIPHWLVTEG